MKKLAKRVQTLLLMGVMAWVLGQVGQVWAMDPNAEDITGPDRGAAILDDDCGDCSLDYTGLRWLGSGGQGGRGVVYWPGGQTGNNYGEMCFTSTCEAWGNPLYAWCTDVYHAAQSAPYGVDFDPALITDDSCRLAQLTALGYLFAWTTPTSIFQDDAYQLAVWKLSDIRNGSENDGIPHFCYDAGRGYPNFADTPVYPYVNTLYCSNAPRNDQANTWVLGSIGKNVILPGDVWADACLGPYIEGDYATVVLNFCLSRGAFAESVNNLGVANILVHLKYRVGTGDWQTWSGLTDEDGCVSLTITQPIRERRAVEVEICSNSSWPYQIKGCTEENYNHKQWLVIAGEVDTLCTRWEIPGDKWLSVELAGFDAYTTANGVDLQWSTASETNADRWEIERCVNGMNVFEKIAEVAAQNSATGATYSFADRNGVSGTTYDYRLVDVDANGVRTAHQTVSARFGDASATVLEYKLADAYPNPFNPSTTISFTVPEAGDVTLRIFDLSGREITTLVNGQVEAGEHTLEWTAEGLPSGTYFYTLSAANYTATKKLMLLK